MRRWLLFMVLATVPCFSATLKSARHIPCKHGICYGLRWNQNVHYTRMHLSHPSREVFDVSPVYHAHFSLSKKSALKWHMHKHHRLRMVLKTHPKDRIYIEHAGHGHDIIHWMRTKQKRTQIKRVHRSHKIHKKTKYHPVVSVKKRHHRPPKHPATHPKTVHHVKMHPSHEATGSSSIHHGGRLIHVVIDPGHGGHDPGAVGVGSIREKSVVLKISQYLKKELERYPGYKVYLTRKDDRYLTLRRRLHRARAFKGDCFIAIHADIFMNRHAKGASVYSLSRRGATNEAARWLADKENESELMGGAPLDSSNWLLKSVMLKMQQSITQDRSEHFSNMVLKELAQVTPLHRRHPDKAAFVVLKSPDIPSILVETGFLSNWHEAKRLNDPHHQQRLARAIAKGVRDYFHSYPPHHTWLEGELKGRTLRVQSGDTLHAIAKRYHTSVGDIQRFNHMKTSKLVLHQTLKIPPRGAW